MEVKSLLIKDTTREQRIRIVAESLGIIGIGCEDADENMIDEFYEPYINGEKELKQLNEEFRVSGKVC